MNFRRLLTGKQVLHRPHLRKILKLLKSNITISYLQKHFIKIKYRNKQHQHLRSFFNAIIYKYICYSNLRDRLICSVFYNEKNHSRCFQGMDKNKSIGLLKKKLNTVSPL